MSVETKVEENFQETTNRHAASAIESMRDDLDALKHAGECNGTDEKGKPCKRGSETKTVTVEGKKYKQQIHSNPEAWHDEEKARQAIEEGHYGVQVRGDWHNPGETDNEAVEYLITLGGGGPASRIVGELDRGQPTSAKYEFQDWFKPWTEADTTAEQDETLLEWVGYLYFGE